MITPALLLLTVMFTFQYINDSVNVNDLYIEKYTYSFLSTPRVDCQWKDEFETKVLPYWSKPTARVISIRVISDKNIHNKTGWMIGSGLRICLQQCFVLQYTSAHTWNALEWNPDLYSISSDDIIVTRHLSVSSLIDIILKNHSPLYHLFWCHHRPLPITK